MSTIDEIMDELKTIKQDIDDAKHEKAKAEGILSEYFKTLKSLGVKSVTDGHKKLKALEKDITKLEDTIQDKFTTLKEVYEW